MGNSCGALDAYTALERYPMYQGGFIWDYIDQFIYQKNRFGEEVLAYGGDFEEVATPTIISAETGLFMLTAPFP